MKTAILADLHLTDNLTTVKMAVLRWALEEAVRAGCGSVCCIGDLTARGSDLQSEEILRQLRKLPVPFFSTPGNGELRIYSDGRNAEKFHIDPPENIPVILLDTSCGEPDRAGLAALQKLPGNSGFLLATHIPEYNWSPGAQEILKQAFQRRAVTALIAGHSHHDAENILRGLDPDKASGGPPMLAVMERLPDGSWQRTDRVMPDADPGQWTADERREFLDGMGITTMYEELTALEFAIENRVKNIELRMDHNNGKNLRQAVKRWRESGGRILSMHLPDLLLSDRKKRLQKFAGLACELGCDRVTLHVPRVTAAEFHQEEGRLLENFAGAMDELLTSGIAVGIENLHTSPGADTFESRNFGCTISECRYWVELLRKTFNTEKIGFHLDIGHCRNNAPLSASENLSDWYLKTGELINGWHLHQVIQLEDGRFANHQPLIGFYGKLISMAGLFMACRAGQLRKAPMFLESRDLAGNLESFKFWSEALK